MSLIAQLGMDQFLTKYNTSFFMHEGLPCIVTGSNRDGKVKADKIDGTINKPTTTAVAIDPEFFTDMGVFATPPLGWRVAGNGRFLVYMQRNNASFHRGTCIDNISISHHEITRWFEQNGGINMDYYTRHSTLCKMVMQPEYVSLAEGLSLIQKGKIVSFAVNELMAVVPAEDGVYDVLFREKKVGTVDENGSVTCTIPYVVSSLEAAA
jgi:hypothetical protein